ncbi:MAG: cbb3-type cytochrome c oxidase subunit I [Candidatus Thermoplasmatota archaeon]|jgi:cytochrome c oxidase subunit 1|nr:cbb3-type cytochrome c oxidase subunit I [Candidatus Thermoplasmatota archaeon]
MTLGLTFELAVFGSFIALLIVMGFLLYYFAVDYKRNLLGEVSSALPKKESNTVLSRMKRELSFSAFMMDDSKSIGIRYLITSLVLFFIAGLAGIGMRISLWFPVPSFLTPVQYNILLTAHGTLMLYGWATGSILGMAYYLLPSSVKLKNDSFGVVSSIMYWMFLVGSLFIIFSKSTATWYFYYPLVDQLTAIGGGQYSFATLIGVMLILIATTVSSVIFLRMIFFDRDPSIRLSNMSLFAWSVVSTAFLIIASAPVSIIANGFLIYDNINPIFFQAGNGSALGYAIMFWYWGHPLVYVAVIPAFGLIYEMLPRFTGTKIYSYKSGVLSLLMLMILSGTVWGHHLFNSGLGTVWDLIFSTTSFIVAVPSAISVFNWIATMWVGRVKLTVPMMFIINGIIDFIIGGVSGVMLADVGANQLIHGTYAVTSHFHFIFLGLTTGVAFAAIYVLFPTLSGGRNYNVPMAKVHFYLSTIGTIVMSGFWLVGGFAGMPRRVAGYFGIFQTYQDAAAVGGVILGIGFLIFLINFLYSAYKPVETNTSNILEEEVTS